MILVNLLPENLRITGEGRWKFLQTPLMRLVLGLAVLCLVSQVFLTVFTVYRSIEIDAVKKKVEELTETNKAIAMRKSQIADLKTKLKDIQAVVDRKFYWSSFLNALTDSMTKGIWIKSFSLADGPLSPAQAKDKKAKPPRTLRLEGSAVSPAGQETAFIARFIKELKSNPLLASLFENIELSNIMQRKIKDVDVYDFVAICTFKKDAF